MFILCFNLKLARRLHGSVRKRNKPGAVILHIHKKKSISRMKQAPCAVAEFLSHNS